MTPSELKRKMERIRKHFDKIEDILNTIPNGLRDEIHDYHVENCGLLHCTRWGLQASEELRDEAKMLIKIAKANGSI